jgi:hypothetical protein
MPRGYRTAPRKIWRPEIKSRECKVYLHSLRFDLQTELNLSQITNFTLYKNEFSCIYVAKDVEMRNLLYRVPYPHTLVIRTRIRDYFYPLIHYHLLLGSDLVTPSYSWMLQFGYLVLYCKKQTKRTQILSSPGQPLSSSGYPRPSKH